MRRGSIFAYQAVSGEEEDDALLDSIVALTSSPVFPELGRKLTDIAITLDVAFETLEAVQNELNQNHLDCAIYILVQSWVKEKGAKANFEVLINALKANGLGRCVSAIEMCLMEGCASSKSTTEAYLFHSNLPPKPSFYLDRKLSTRSTVSYKIFDQKCADIIVLTGMEMYELCDAVKKGQASTSTNQIEEEEALTARFIILEQFNHFEIICRKTDKPVHWLRKEDDGRLRWLRSCRGRTMSLLHSIFDRKIQDDFYDDEFVSVTLAGRKCVVIGDKPGMGGSCIVEEVGRKLRKEYPGRLMAYFQMDHFIKILNTRTIEKGLEEVCCNSPLGKVVFKERFLEAKEKMEVLIDGMNTLGDEEFKRAKEIIEKISKMGNVRVWVSLREHLMNELEDQVGELGFNILPFSEEEQVDALAYSWDENGLDHYASGLLKTLRSGLEEKDEGILGVPLHCAMLAELFTGHPEETEPIVKSISSLFDLLVDKRFQGYLWNSKGNRLSKKELEDLHIMISLKQLFPNDFDGIKENFKRKEFGEIEKIGFVKGNKFVHLSFAEYFAAKFAVSSLKLAEACPEALLHFVFKTILRSEMCEYPIYNEMVKSFKFVNGNIAYFLNSLIGDIGESESFGLLLSLEAYLDLVLKSGMANQVRTSLVHASIQANLGCVFKLILALNLFQRNKMLLNEADLIKMDDVKIFDEGLLLLSIKFANFEVVEVALNELEESSKFYGKILCLAVERGDYPITDFLLSHQSIRRMVEENREGVGQRLLHFCVRHSDSDSKFIIADKLKIIERLNEINGELINSVDPEGNGATPVLENGVDAKLLRKLIELGADCLVLDHDKNSFLHSTLNRSDVSSEDYQSILELVDKVTLRQLIKQKNKDKCTPLGKLIRRRNPLDSTLELFNELGADFNYVDGTKLSIIAQAVVARRSGKVIRKLMECGANPKWTGIGGRGLLHLGAEAGNLEALRILVEDVGLKVNKKDWECKTPLDYAVEEWERGEEGEQVEQYLKAVGGERGEKRDVSEARMWLRRSLYELRNKLNI